MMAKRPTKKTNAIAASHKKVEEATTDKIIDEVIPPPAVTPTQKRIRKKNIRKAALIGYATAGIAAVVGFLPQLLTYDSAPNWLKVGTVIVFALSGALHYASEPDKPKEAKPQ